MCYRYVLHLEALQALAEYLAIARPVEWRSRYNLAPGQQIPVVRRPSTAEAREIVILRWGLVPAWARNADTARAPANARAESLAVRPTFREAFRHRRCLIPASGFYEWQGHGRRRQPFLFRRQDGKPFFFAGLWEAWHDPIAGRAVETCAIITTAPNELVRPIHDRMPAILEPEDNRCWLDPSLTQPGDLVPLLRPFPAGTMTATPVTSRVNDIRHDDASCLEPAPLGATGDDQAQFPLGL
jgi:putative SOS response-associated peptidase YedK